MFFVMIMQFVFGTRSAIAVLTGCSMFVSIGPGFIKKLVYLKTFYKNGNANTILNKNRLPNSQFIPKVRPKYH